MIESPTLELQAAVVRHAPAGGASPVTVRSTARRLGLVGEAPPLVDALTGRASITAGSARLLGCDLPRALAAGSVGIAASDAPLPESFTAREYLEHAARLSHGGKQRAAMDAQGALQRFGLVELASRKLGTLEAYQRRALGIALATLTAPSLVWLESPLAGLDAPSAEYISRLCAEAARDARVVITSPWPVITSFERALLETCDELLLFARAELIAQGPPAELFAATGHYALTLAGEALGPFYAALEAAGCRLVPRAEQHRWSLELPRGQSSDLVFDLALDHGVDVLELDPSYGA